MLLSGPYTEYKVELLDAEYKESASYYIDFKEAFLEAFSEARRISGSKHSSQVQLRHILL